MIVELGHFALILALAAALLQGSLPMIGAARGDAAWMAVARPAAFAQLVLIVIAFGALTHAYVTSDFSVFNVVQNSHSAKPLLYKITGVWGNHEGSMLLWILILAVFGSAVAAFGGNLPPTLRARVLAVQAWIGIGFIAFTLLTSNPFLRQFPAPLNGEDLNPLLQDPGLAFHQPLLSKLTGGGGTHGGAMVLGIRSLAVFGSAVAAFGGTLPPTLRARVLAVQAWIGIGFIAFTLLTSNPFLRQFPAPLNGEDLNPLLQDPGLAFHPPMLYAGYVG